MPQDSFGSLNFSDYDLTPDIPTIDSTPYSQQDTGIDFTPYSAPAPKPQPSVQLQPQQFQQPKPQQPTSVVQEMPSGLSDAINWGARNAFTGVASMFGVPPPLAEKVAPYAAPIATAPFFGAD